MQKVDKTQSKRLVVWTVIRKNSGGKNIFAFPLREAVVSGGKQDL